MADQQQPVIIKRIKKGAHGHHGGAWKLAYADFVTAMMAFFLLLWLLNAVTEEQLKGIADYFAPTTVSQSNNGAGGVLGGTALGPGAMTSDGSPPSFTLSLPPPTIGNGGDAATDPKEGYSDQKLQGASDKPEEGAGDKPGVGNAARQAGNGQQIGAAGNQQQLQSLSQQQIDQIAAQHEEQQFQQAQQALKQAINSIPELAKLANSLMVDDTPEGLRIQIVDQEGLAMFPSGSANMFGPTRALLELVGRVIKQLPEKIAISGHTDSTPFVGQTNYGNWELSSDRALAARRVLVSAGVPPDRVNRVVGQAENEPLIKNNPADPRNRRLSIVLLRDNVGPVNVNVTTQQMQSGQVPSALGSAPQPAAAPALPRP